MWTPLRQQTKAGDRVGVLGLGGLGSMGVKFARALGCSVTAIRLVWIMIGLAGSLNFLNPETP